MQTGKESKRTKGDYATRYRFPFGAGGGGDVLASSPGVPSTRLSWAGGVVGHRLVIVMSLFLPLLLLVDSTFYLYSLSLLSCELAQMKLTCTV